MIEVFKCECGDDEFVSIEAVKIVNVPTARYKISKQGDVALTSSLKHIINADDGGQGELHVIEDAGPLTELLVVGRDLRLYIGIEDHDSDRTGRTECAGCGKDYGAFFKRDLKDGVLK